MPVYILSDNQNDDQSTDLSMNDAQEAIAVIRQSIRNICGPCYSKQEIDKWCENKTASNFLDWASQSNTTVLKLNNGSVSGVGMISGTGMILLLYTKPELTHHGIGREILEKLIETAYNMKLSRVEVYASLTSINFYLKHGFNVPENVIELDGQELCDIYMIKTITQKTL